MHIPPRPRHTKVDDGKHCTLDSRSPFCVFFFFLSLPPFSPPWFVNYSSLYHKFRGLLAWVRLMIVARVGIDIVLHCRRRHLHFPYTTWVRQTHAVPAEPRPKGRGSKGWDLICHAPGTLYSCAHSPTHPHTHHLPTRSLLFFGLSGLTFFLIFTVYVEPVKKKGCPFYPDTHDVRVLRLIVVLSCALDTLPETW